MEIHETSYVAIGKLGNVFTATLKEFNYSDPFKERLYTRDVSMSVAIAKLEEASRDNLALCDVVYQPGYDGRSLGIVADFS
jgi:hypothetical protein